MHDIYDPPPVPPVDWDPPEAEPLIFTRGDLVCLVSLCAGLLVAGTPRLAERADPGPRSPPGPGR